MKIRNSFVSNSSSVSFIVYGFSSYSDFIEKNKIKLSLDWGNCVKINDKEITSEDNKLIRSSENCQYFGLALAEEHEHTFNTDMKNDETLEQFKERSRLKLSHLFGSEVKHEDMWLTGASFRDG